VLVERLLLSGSIVLSAKCLILSWAFLDILLYPLYSYAYLGIQSHQLAVSHLPVMMLSHEIAT